MKERSHGVIDFGAPVDKTKHIIKVVGVGGGGCNAVKNMYKEGIHDVTFAVCNTDSQSLSKSPVPVKVLLGERGLGVGGVPEQGRKEAEESIEAVKELLSDDTKMVFITAGMGGGTGTGAGPVVAGIAKQMGMLTVGVVTIPFYFEKEKKIIKALKGVEEMRKNVDALLIVNNERLCDIYSNSRISVKDAFKRADTILSNAVKSISELITIEGDINLDFCDVESTMKGGGGAIMAIGRAGGEHRVEKAIVDALDSPLLYGSDVSKAKRILFNIYTSPDNPLFVDELQEIDAFMDELSPQIEVIWGVSEDNTLENDAKIAILATGLDEDDSDFSREDGRYGADDKDYYRSLMKKLYSPGNGRANTNPQDPDRIPITVVEGNDSNETVKSYDTVGVKDEEQLSGQQSDNVMETGGYDDNIHVQVPEQSRPVTPVPLVDRLKGIWHDLLKE